MSDHYAQLTDAFEVFDIPPGKFSHADHVGVAYQMLRRYDFLEASMRYAKSINTIATAAGAPDKFNVTVTLAFLSLIAERMQTSAHDDYDEFVAKNPDLFSSNLLDKWYDHDQLGTELARTIFVMPSRNAA